MKKALTVKKKKTTARVAAICLLKPNSRVSLNNRHVVNNSAIMKVLLRKGFLIFM